MMGMGTELVCVVSPQRVTAADWGQFLRTRGSQGEGTSQSDMHFQCIHISGKGHHTFYQLLKEA